MLLVFLFLVPGSFCEGVANTTSTTLGTTNSSSNILFNTSEITNTSIASFTSSPTLLTTPSTTTATTSSKTAESERTVSTHDYSEVTSGSGQPTTSRGSSLTSTPTPHGSGKPAPDSHYDTLVSLVAVTLTVVIILIVCIVITGLFLWRRWGTKPRGNDPPDLYRLERLPSRHHDTDAQHGERPDASHVNAGDDISLSGQETYDAVGDLSPPNAYCPISIPPPSTKQKVESAHEGGKKKMKKQRSSDKMKLKPDSASSASLDTEVDGKVYENW